GSVQALPYFSFIVVHFRGVDVAIAEAKRLLDHPRAAASAQLPGAEPKKRDPGAVRGNFRAYRGTHVSHFGACGGLTIRESGRTSLAISAISVSLSRKSRLPRFSARRLRLDVRGIGMICCCSRNRSATCAGVLL